jgi:hypothetical protein
MKIKKKLKKIIITCLVILNIFSLTVLPVYAGMTSVLLGDPVGTMDTVLGELGIDKNELKNTMKTINVARRKINPPMVSLTFDPADPVPGEKVTVTAMPTNFINTTENLYFTWYIKSKACEKDENKDKCDLDGKNGVDIEDYKIKAARILANDDFVWQPPETVYTEANHKDGNTDGYEAVFGGDDQRGKDTHCFVHNVKTGDDYELKECKHLFPNAPGDTTGGSDGKFGLSEEKFWHTNPNNKDTASTGNTDEANVAGLGENTITFPFTAGDKIGVVVEGSAIQPTQEKDSSYRTMWAFSKNNCEPKNMDHDAGYPKITGPTVQVYKDTHTIAGTPPTRHFELNYTSTDTTTTTQTTIPETKVNDNVMLRTKTIIKTVVHKFDPATALTTIEPPDLYSYTSTCPTSTYAQGGTINEDGVTYTCTGPDVDATISSTGMDVNDLNACLESNLVSPSEGGGTTEKLDTSLKYLPENPINDTSDNKDGDEVTFTSAVANATNANALNYTWEIFAGEDVADPDNWILLGKDMLTEVGITQMSGLGIITLKLKLNFKDANFQAFTSKKLPKFLKVKVTAKETLLEGKEREGHADVTLPLSSSTETLRVYTAASVYLSSGATTESIYISRIPVGERYEGELDGERCLLEIPTKDSVGNITTTIQQEAVCEVVKDEMIGVVFDNTGTEKYTEFLWTLDGATQVCPDENFISCSDATGKSTARTYFPILKGVGDKYTVGLSALNKETGKRIELTKVFKVTVPGVKIVPKYNSTTTDNKDASGNQTCKGIKLGDYEDFLGNTYNDRSEIKFQALTGNNIVLTPEFSGTVASKDIPLKNKVHTTDPDEYIYPYQWNIDGVIIDSYDTARKYGYSIDMQNYGKLTLPPKESGEKYLISLSTTFAPNNSIKKMLNKYWNINYNEFYEKKLSHNIEIEMTDIAPLAQKETSSKKIFATVSSGIPNYIAFLFRIVLSGFAIILAIKIIFFILPKTNTNEF